MPELLVFISVLLIAGITAGFLAGLFGIGGGLVFVPCLFFLFLGHGLSEGLAMALAVGTSLSTIVFSSTASALAHYRLNNIDFSLCRLWMLPLVCGVLLASKLVVPEFGRVLVFVFVALLLLVAIKMYFDFLNDLPAVFKSSRLLQVIISFFIGIISTLAGVGGGALAVPAMIISGVKTHKAVGSAALMGVFVSVPAALIVLCFSSSPINAPPFTYGLVNYLALTVLALCAIVVAPYGARLGKRISEKKLKRLFACCLLLVASSMLLKIF